MRDGLCGTTLWSRRMGDASWRAAFSLCLPWSSRGVEFFPPGCGTAPFDRIESNTHNLLQQYYVAGRLCEAGPSHISNQIYQALGYYLFAIKGIPP